MLIHQARGAICLLEGSRESCKQKKAPLRSSWIGGPQLRSEGYTFPFVIGTNILFPGFLTCFFLYFLRNKIPETGAENLSRQLEKEKAIPFLRAWNCDEWSKNFGLGPENVHLGACLVPGETVDFARARGPRLLCLKLRYSSFAHLWNKSM